MNDKYLENTLGALADTVVPREASPEDIGGQAGVNEVKALYLVTPRQGTCLLFKKDDPALVVGHETGILLLDAGYLATALPSDTLTYELFEADKTTPLDTTPPSYPHDMIIVVTRSPKGGANLIGVRVRRTPGSWYECPVITEAVGERWSIPPLSLVSAGTYNLDLLFDSGERVKLDQLVMNPPGE